MSWMLTDAFTNCGTSGIVGALRDRGLRAEIVRDVIAAENLPAAIAIIASLPFAGKKDSAARLNIQQVEHIVRRSLLECIEKIERFAWGAVKDFLLAMAMRHECRNLTVIRRWIAYRRPADAAPLLYEHRLSFLRRCDGIPNSVEALSRALRNSPMRNAFNNAETSYAANQDIFEFDLALDVDWLRTSVKLLGGIDSRILVTYLGNQSVINILWLKFYRHMSPEETFHSFVPINGFFDVHDYWNAVAAETPGDFAERLASHPTTAYLRDIGAAMKSAGDLAAALRRHLWSLIHRRKGNYAFDSENIIAFVIGWELIADDVVSALQTKSLGMQRDELLPLLVTTQPEDAS